jgi:hypothetical protein
MGAPEDSIDAQTAIFDIFVDFPRIFHALRAIFVDFP